MASQADKIPSIHMFFEKNTDDVRQIKDARLYQDMLRYARSINSDFPENSNRHRFTAWQLTAWLIDNHREYIEYYNDLSTWNTPKHVRIASRLERIEGILDKFGELGLIQRLENVKAERGDTTTTSYALTDFGHILAWIVDAKNRGTAEQKIYDFMEYHFTDTDPTSRDIFYSTLYKKFKEKGVYGEFVIDTLRKRIKSNAPIWSMTELFESLLFTGEDSTSNPQLYRDLWKETMSQMPDNVKKLILYDLKLDIERKMFELVKDVKRYERSRYSLREKYDILAMEAKCEKCHYVRYIEISIQEYLEIIEPTGYDEPSDICPQCQSRNSTVTPI